MNAVPIVINGRRVGPGEKVYVIAEISANHGQSYEHTVKMVEAAKGMGADAVKLQTYTPDTITLDSDRPEFRVAGGMLWDGRLLYDLYKEAYTPWEWQPKLKKIANSLGLDCFSSAFDPSAVDFLEKMNVPVHKVASFEVVDIPLIEKMASTKKPMIISTGMATLEEIEDAVNAARLAGASGVALLKCTSAYPAPPEEMNLAAIPDLARRFGLPVGLSDHTMGIEVPVAAVAMGACIIEKHFTLSRAMKGPDSTFSLEPAEFKQMVEGIRKVEKAIGAPRYEAAEHEKASRVYRRSLFAVRDIREGEAFTHENIRSIRPGHGLAPKNLAKILGKKAARPISRGTPLDWLLIRDV